jgi:ATP-binding cassette subfamily A (ABC1) protein 1
MSAFEQGQGKQRWDTRFGAVLMSENESVGTLATILYNTTSVHAVPIYVGAMSDALKRHAAAGSSITTRNYPMPLLGSEKLQKVISAAVNLFSTFVVIEAFSFIPAAVVAYVVREREDHHNSKHQQLISGVGIFAYWTSNLLWDWTVYLVPMALSLMFIKIFNITAFI